MRASNALCLFSALVFSVSHANAQLPADWNRLPVERFLETVGPLVDSGSLSTQEQQSVTSHAWSQFLQDAAFISTGDWTTVNGMVNSFGESSESLGEQAEAALTQLRNNLKSRLATDSRGKKAIGIYDLGSRTNGLGDVEFSKSDTSDVFAEWMDQNEWQSFDLASLHNLYNWVSEDSLDRRSFSAKWTGTITVPRTGEYTFRQVEQYNGTNSKLLITIDNQVVIDSRNSESTSDKFTSRPIQLRGGEPLSIRVEMTHDVTRIDYSEGAPMVVLTWKSAGMPESIIPSSVLSPPAGNSAENRTGLLGEYYSDIEFTQAAIQRIDPALDLAWSWPPTAPKHHEKASAVLDACIAKILSRDFLRAAVEENNSQVFSYLMWRIAYRMSATEREQLVNLLLSEQEVLAYMTPQMMGRLYQGIYFLPNKNQLELIGEWSLAREQPRIVLGEFPGWGEKAYQKLNTDFFWLTGLFIQGPYLSDIEELWDSYLERSDGECNLTIVYLTAVASRENNMLDKLRSKLFSSLDRPEIVGDQKATWYLGLGYLEEMSTRMQWPGDAVSYAREAFDVAETEEYRFWALQEIVARMGSCGECDEALSMIQNYRTDFGSERFSAEMESWTTRINEIRQAYEKLAADRKKEAIEAYVQEIEKRRQKAIANNNPNGRSRYDSIIESAKISE